MQYIYLHGFASGNNALKANFFKAKLSECGINLVTPDLNEDDFTNLTMTRQIEHVKKLIDPTIPITLLGSSMGGLLALILAQELGNIQRIILFAPAIQMAKRWMKRAPEQLEKWKNDGYTLVHHYGYKKEMPLNYKFIEDLAGYTEEKFTRELPTLIFHGTQDTTVPHEVSAKYAKNKDYVSYYELSSDHSLENQVNYMWQIIRPFMGI